MKNKLFLFISLILIAFILITSYNPQAAQAEIIIQDEPISETEGILITDNVEQPAVDGSIFFSDLDNPDFTEEDLIKPDAEHGINANAMGFFNAVGKNFVPRYDLLHVYSDTTGCLWQGYDFQVPQIWSIPVNIPNNSKGSYIFFTYKVPFENTVGNIQVRLYRRSYKSLETELVRGYTLDKQTVGEYFSYFPISDIIFDTNYWLYRLEFELPSEPAIREFCGVQIQYENPPNFPVALPMISTNQE